MVDPDDPGPGEPSPTEGSKTPQPPRMSHQEMLETLGVMARQLAAEAPDTLKETTAVAAEWTAHAARSSAPYAHKVADAAEEVRAAANHVTKLGGGRGAVRETIEFILKAKKRWADLIHKYQ